MNFVLRVLARARTPRVLIGPPHPVSNIRPFIFEDPLIRSNVETHPYSLTEFSPRAEDDADLQWRIERERLNAFNHAFWLDSNTRFMLGKQHALERFNGQEVPPSPEEKETALSEFYSRWSAQESERQAAYTAEWNRRNRAVILLGMRRQLRIWRGAFRSAFIRQAP